MLNTDLSPADPQGGELPQIKPVWCQRTGGSRQTVSPEGHIESIVAHSFVPSDFLVDGQVRGLGTVHLLLTMNFFSK